MISNTSHYHDIHYNFNKEQFENIVNWAKEYSYEIRIDLLQNGYFTRQRTNNSLDYFLEERKMSKFKHDVVIHRRGHEDWKDNVWYPHEWCIEIGSRIDSKEGDLFLFMYLKEDFLEEMITKFNLTEK